LVKVVPAGQSFPSTERLGFELDRNALSIMADKSAVGSLVPELTSVLLIHTGEVGRHPDTIKEILRGTGNRTDLHSRLIAENLIELEDNSPAARVRAYDWLKEAGKAPANFDPLGDAASRRTALSANSNRQPQ